ncbi:MAG: tetratricopeptide repeat protein [Synergistaceae bacterium]|jgi:tetratricopeptide (TPR) repeat protein|nr:tetratricopeptide repeat protein [Synergistaceae bacterium]
MRDRLSRVLIKAVLSSVVLVLISLAVMAVLPGTLYADRKSPPDESVRPTASQEEEAAKKKQAEAARKVRVRRDAVEAEARKNAAAEAARKAAAAKEKAERDAEDAQRAASEDMINRTLFVGRNLVENGRYRSAVVVMRAFLDEHPDFADAWYLLSRAHHALGDYDRAQIAANIALDIDPYYPDLVKTPNGLQPVPILTKQQRKEPRPSMSVLPIKQPLPANLLLEPVVISFPILVESEAPPGEGYADSRFEPEGSDPLTGAYLQYAPLIPDPLGATVSWMQSERFNEISRWRFRVDRMGILTYPRVPIAWKGSRPYEIYFWTGEEWARVRRKGTRRAAYDYTLYIALPSIEEVLTDRGFQWYEPDTPSLAASASLMRYKWVGDVDLIDAEIRVEKRTGERARPRSVYVDTE